MQCHTQLLTKIGGWDWQDDWRIALGGVSDLGLAAIS